MHLTPRHWLLLLPVLALVLTPFVPFVNTPADVLGLPPILYWVGGWAIATTLILQMLYRDEPELDDTTTEKETRA
jgi:hypothetical protein